MKRNHKEYGGFLPLELNPGQEYYSGYEGKLMRFNCAKAAVGKVIEDTLPEKIFVPHYLCPNVCKEIESHNAKVIYYFINENLLPIDNMDKEGCCIYLVNYFGVMDKAIEAYAKGIRKATLIIDNCHSFFKKPIVAGNIYNIYSAKKFFGIPDGAYLIAENLKGNELEADYSWEYANYLLACVEHGTNYCYKLKKEVDVQIAENYGGMSILAKRILEAVDYENVRTRRKENFQKYHETFQKINMVRCEEESAPYAYPLNIGKNIKKELVIQKIYVPTLWERTLKDEFKGSLEYSLSENTIFLPVDQRYQIEDIAYIIDIVNNIRK